MEVVASKLIDTPILFQQKKDVVFIYNPGYMCNWIRGYYTKNPEDAERGIYTDIATGWNVSKLDDFIRNYDLDKGLWNMHTEGWFSEKMNKVLDYVPFGDSITRIIKTMDIALHRYNMGNQVLECYVGLSKGVLVYTIRAREDLGNVGQIVFVNDYEIKC